MLKIASTNYYYNYHGVNVLPTPKDGGFCFIGNSLFPVGNYGLTFPPQGTTTCPERKIIGNIKPPTIVGGFSYIIFSRTDRHG